MVLPACEVLALTTRTSVATEQRKWSFCPIVGLHLTKIGLHQTNEYSGLPLGSVLSGKPLPLPSSGAQIGFEPIGWKIADC